MSDAPVSLASLMTPSKTVKIDFPGYEDGSVLLYIEAFLQLFESGYAPHVGDVERIANKRVRKLYITFPNNYSSIY